MDDKITIKNENGSFILTFEGKSMEISKSEAAIITHDPKLVYDVIIAHNRKFYFNASEDTIIK